MPGHHITDKCCRCKSNRLKGTQYSHLVRLHFTTKLFDSRKLLCDCCTGTKTSRHVEEIYHSYPWHTAYRYTNRKNITAQCVQTCHNNSVWNCNFEAQDRTLTYIVTWNQWCSPRDSGLGSRQSRDSFLKSLGSVSNFKSLGSARSRDQKVSVSI